MSLPPYFSVSSADPFERGRRLGSAAGELVRETVAAYDETFRHYTGLTWDAVVDRATAYREVIGEYDGAVLAEMDGIAAGAGLSAGDVLAINVRTEVMFGLAREKAPSECTAFFVGPQTAADGRALLGQNWDWRARSENSVILVDMDQGPDLPALTTVVEAGLLAKAGFNAAGVGLATNALVTDLDRGEPGVPYHVLLRSILNAQTLEQAVATVVSAHRSSSANYLIGNAAGNAVNLEVGPGGVETVYLTQPVQGTLGHANDFRCATSFTDLGAGKWPDSPRRFERMLAGVRQGPGNGVGADVVKDLLRDHTDYPVAICRHPNSADDPVEQVATDASIIIDLAAGTAELTVGRPCEQDFVVHRPAWATTAVG